MVSGFGMINYDRGVCSCRGDPEGDRGMTHAPDRPKKKDPQVRSWCRRLPPQTRSRAALGLTAAAARRGVLRCSIVLNAARFNIRRAMPACHACACDLAWRETHGAGSGAGRNTHSCLARSLFPRTPAMAAWARCNCDAGPIGAVPSAWRCGPWRHGADGSANSTRPGRA